MPMNLLFLTTLIIVNIAIKHSVVSEKPPAEANDFQTNLEEALKYGLINVLEKENNEKIGPIDLENNKEMESIDSIEDWTTDPDEWVTVQNFESENIRKTVSESEFTYNEDFIVASYGSIAFRALREKWAINKSLMTSLKSGLLIGQCSAGNSGCGFYHTKDGQFMLKSILGEEEEFFQQGSEAFRHYYSYMMQKSKGEQSSLLVKYLGFFRFIILPKNQLRENFNLPFVVMPNIFPKNFPIDWKFDLKGTLDESRCALDRNPMIKDLEFVGSEEMKVKGLFKAGIDFNSVDYKWLLAVLDSDLKALAKMGRYDYSLILSIHILEHEENVENFLDRKKGLLRAYCKFCTLPSGVETDKIPARSQLQHTEGRQLLVGIGIVDTLKPYSTLKSAIAKIHKEIHGRPRVVASPDNYAKRFINILKGKYFPPKKTKLTNKKKGTANGFPNRKGSSKEITNGFARKGSNKGIANGFVPKSAAGVKV